MIRRVCIVLVAVGASGCSSLAAASGPAPSRPLPTSTGAPRKGTGRNDKEFAEYLTD